MIRAIYSKQCNLSVADMLIKEMFNKIYQNTPKRFSYVAFALNRLQHFISGRPS